MNLSTKIPSKAIAADGRGSRSGFTLLEIVFGIGLMALVLTGIYSVAAASLNLSNKVTQSQQDAMHLQSLLGVLRRNIEDIPGNAKISMEPPEGLGGTLRSEIVLEDYPLAFTWAGVAAGSKRVLIISDKDPRGGTRIRIRYLNAEEAEAHAEGGQVSDEGIGMDLIEGLKGVSWRFYNQRTEEWEEDWVRPNERPSLVEMMIDFFDGSASLRSVFWIPVVVNPETVVRGVGRTSNSRGGTTAPRTVRPPPNNSQGGQRTDTRRGGSQTGSPPGGNRTVVRPPGR